MQQSRGCATLDIFDHMNEISEIEVGTAVIRRIVGNLVIKVASNCMSDTFHVPTK
jgi:hypothetical protein